MRSPKGIKQGASKQAVPEPDLSKKWLEPGPQLYIYIYILESSAALRAASILGKVSQSQIDLILGASISLAYVGMCIQMLRPIASPDA